MNYEINITHSSSHKTRLKHNKLSIMYTVLPLTNNKGKETAAY